MATGGIKWIRSLTLWCLVINYMAAELNEQSKQNQTPMNENSTDTSKNERTNTVPPPVPYHEVLVHTKMGTLKGKVTQRDGIVTSQFLGVPYALPPTRERRFLPPTSNFGWPLDDVWNAMEYKPLCYRDATVRSNSGGGDDNHHRHDSEDVNQPVDEHDEWTTFSEDCLYLNMYVPRNISSLEHVNTLNLPVLVYLHGGDFSHSRHGNGSPYDGSHLADRGDVIVASLDYRQGVLGFFSLLEGVAPGNLGLLDQRQALHWIWDNVQEFGGNAAAITVFGHGFGGVSVGCHIVSPLSKGLFTRTAIQSGSVLAPGMIQRAPIDNAMALVRALGCDVYNNNTDRVACLRNEPVAHILEMAAVDRVTTTSSLALVLLPTSSVVTSSPSLASSSPKLSSASSSSSSPPSQMSSPWMPVIDGTLLPESPHTLLEQGQHNKVSTLLGANTRLADTLARQRGYSRANGLHKFDLEREIRQTLTPAFSRNLEQAVVLTLTQYDFCEKTPQQRYTSLVNFLTDYLYLYPSYEMAKLLSRSDNPVYFYEFSHTSSSADQSGSAENKFVFGDVSEEEEHLSAIVMEGWTNFAVHG